MAVAMPVTMLVAPGPEVASATPNASRGARVAIGHVRGALLVAHQNMVNGGLGHGIIGRQDGAAGIAEDVLHAQELERLPDNLRSRESFTFR